MLNKLQDIKKRHSELEKSLSDPSVIADNSKFQEYLIIGYGFNFRPGGLAYSSDHGTIFPDDNSFLRFALDKYGSGNIYLSIFPLFILIYPDGYSVWDFFF